MSDYVSKLDERSVSGDESINTPIPPPGQKGAARPFFWGAGNISARMQTFVTPEGLPDLGLDQDGCPIIPKTPAELIGQSLPGHLRKAYFDNLRGDPAARAAAEDLATRASMTVLKESLPAILAEAIKLAKK